MSDSDRSDLASAITFIKTSDLSYNCLNNINDTNIIDGLIELKKMNVDFNEMISILESGEMSGLEYIKNYNKLHHTNNTDDIEIITESNNKNSIIDAKNKELLDSVNKELLDKLKLIDIETLNKLFKYKYELLDIFDNNIDDQNNKINKLDKGSVIYELCD